jgi:hypothetical protein
MRTLGDCTVAPRRRPQISNEAMGCAIRQGENVLLEIQATIAYLQQMDVGLLCLLCKCLDGNLQSLFFPGFRYQPTSMRKAIPHQANTLCNVAAISMGFKIGREA